jgi:hypothetical protein
MTIESNSAQSETKVKRDKIERQTQFIELRARGLSYDRIGSEMGVAKNTLLTWGRELTQEISNAKSLFLAELLEKYAVSKTKRIEAFGGELQRIL